MGYCMYMQDAELFVATEHVGRVFALIERTRYDFELNAEGDIIDIIFRGETLRDDFEMFQKVAPYVQNGSFVEMIGENGDRWRWVFKDGECLEMNAIISWPDIGGGS